MRRRFLIRALHAAILLLTAPGIVPAAEPISAEAATFFREQVATHGGYVYYCAEDLSLPYGEGEATPDQIWVQPPGTPAVGLAYLRAYHATSDRYYLEASP